MVLEVSSTWGPLQDGWWLESGILNHSDVMGSKDELLDPQDHLRLILCADSAEQGLLGCDTSYGSVGEYARAVHLLRQIRHAWKRWEWSSTNETVPSGHLEDAPRAFEAPERQFGTKEHACQDGVSKWSSKADQDGRELFSEAAVAAAALQALLGYPALRPLMSGRACTPSVRPGALRDALSKVAQAGLQRFYLLHFVQHHRAYFLSDGGDPTLAALVHAIGNVLCGHSVLLASIASAACVRRQEEDASWDYDFSNSKLPTTTLLEVMQHSHQYRQQVSFMAELCWCTEVRKSDVDRRPRWQVEDFPTGSSLMDYLHDVVMHASSMIPLCRYLFGAAVTPLATGMWLWTHTLEPAPQALFVSKSEHARFMSLTRAAVPAQPAHLDLPAFMAPLRDVVLLAGQQLRFLARLPQAHLAIESTVRQALSQLRQAGMLSASPGHVALTDAADFIWSCRAGATEIHILDHPLVWSSDALRTLQRLNVAGVRARASRLEAMIASLARQRAVEEHATLATQLARIRGHEEEVRKLEDDAAAQAVARQQAKATLLQQQLVAAESQAARRQAAEEQRREEEAALLRHIVHQDAVAQLNAFGQAVHQAVATHEQLSVQEARMAWRMARWKLFKARLSRIEAIATVEKVDLARVRADAVRRKLEATHLPASTAVTGSALAGSDVGTSLASATSAATRTFPLRLACSRPGSLPSDTSFPARSTRKSAGLRRVGGFAPLPGVAEEDTKSTGDTRSQFHDAPELYQDAGLTELSEQRNGTSGAVASQRAAVPNQEGLHFAPSHMRDASPSKGTDCSNSQDCDARVELDAAAVSRGGPLRSDLPWPGAVTSDVIAAAKQPGAHRPAGPAFGYASGPDMRSSLGPGTGVAPVASTGAELRSSSSVGGVSVWGAGTSSLYSDPAQPASTGGCFNAATSAPSIRESPTSLPELPPFAVSVAPSSDSLLFPTHGVPTPLQIQRASIAQGHDMMWGGERASFVNAAWSSPSIPDGSSVTTRSQGSSLRKAWQRLRPSGLMGKPEGAGGHTVDLEGEPVRPGEHMEDVQHNVLEEDVPTVCVLDTCLREPLVAQYRLLSRACLQIICQELNLRSTAALLCGAAMAAEGRLLADVVELVDSHAVAGAHLTVGRLNDLLPTFRDSTPGMDEVLRARAASFQFILEPSRQVAAEPASRVASSSIQMDSMSLHEWQDEETSSWSGAYPAPPGGGTMGAPGAATAPSRLAGVLLETRNLASVDMIRLVCSVHGPLSVVLTPASLEHYADVFTALVRMRWVSVVIARLLLDIRKSMQRHSGKHGSGGHAVAQNASRQMLHILLDFQAMHKFVQCLEAAIGTDTLLSEWKAFERDLGHADVDSRATSAVRTADLSWLVQRHARFAAACAEGALLEFDQHLCTSIARLLQVAMTSASGIRRKLYGRPEAKVWDPMERISDTNTLTHVQGLCGEVRDRLHYVTARLGKHKGHTMLENMAVLMAVGGKSA